MHFTTKLIFWISHFLKKTLETLVQLQWQVLSSRKGIQHDVNDTQNKAHCFDFLDFQLYLRMFWEFAQSLINRDARDLLGRWNRRLLFASFLFIAATLLGNEAAYNEKSDAACFACCCSRFSPSLSPVSLHCFGAAVIERSGPVTRPAPCRFYTLVPCIYCAFNWWHSAKQANKAPYKWGARDSWEAPCLPYQLSEITAWRNDHGALITRLPCRDAIRQLLSSSRTFHRFN